MPALLLDGQGWSSIAEFKQLGPFDGDVAMLQIQMSRLSMRGELHARRAEKESGGPFTEAAAESGCITLQHLDRVSESSRFTPQCNCATQCNFDFGEAQYQELLRCAECCEEAASLSNGAVGRREGQGQCKNHDAKRNAIALRRLLGMSTEMSQSQVSLFCIVKVPSPTFAWPCIFLCGYQRK